MAKKSKGKGPVKGGGSPVITPKQSSSSRAGSSGKQGSADQGSWGYGTGDYNAWGSHQTGSGSVTKAKSKKVVVKKKGKKKKKKVSYA